MLYNALPAFPPGVAVVEENGPGASKFSQGTRVVGAGVGAAASFGTGTWAQFISVPENDLVRWPSSRPNLAPLHKRSDSRT